MRNDIIKNKGIKDDLKILSFALHKIGLIKVSQKIQELAEPEEYDEPWHEEAVKEFGHHPVTDDEELYELEDTIYKDYSISNSYGHDMYVFDKLGIKLVSASGDTLLGRGAFGRVYNGIYNGKPVAIKISKQEDEASIWKSILDRSKSLSPNVSKYIPKIYDLKNYNINHLTGSIIIMEKLLPLPKEVAYAWRYGRENTEYKVSWKDRYNPINLYNLLHSLLGKKLLVPDFNKFNNIVSDVPAHIEEYSSVHGISKDVSGLIIRFIEKENNIELFGSADYNRVYGATRWYLINLFDNSSSEEPFSFRAFPNEHNRLNNDQYSGLSPEFKNILYALLELKSAGIFWGDLHANNVMISQDDKQLKIVDIGYFEVK